MRPPSEEYPNLDALALKDMGVAKVQDLDVTHLIGNGIIHTKLWVVDRKHFYVGSANMDWRSLTQVCYCLGLNFAIAHCNNVSNWDTLIVLTCLCL